MASRNHEPTVQNNLKAEVDQTDENKTIDNKRLEPNPSGNYKAKENMSESNILLEAASEGKSRR